MIFKNFQLILAGGSFSFKYTFNAEILLPVYPPFKSMVEQFALPLYLYIEFILFI